MTDVQIPAALQAGGLDEMLATELGYHHLIQWLTSLDAAPLRRTLGLPDGALVVTRHIEVSDTCHLDLVFSVDGVPHAVAQVALGLPSRVADKWVFDQWCSVRGIDPTRRFVFSLGGDVLPTWSVAPGWQTSVSFLSLLAEWRDTSGLAFVRELATHAHALAEEVLLQTRGTLAHVESDVARSLIAKRLRVAFRERYPAGSGVVFPPGDADVAKGTSASLCVPVPTGGHIILQVAPKGGKNAKPGCAWDIKILAAVGEPSILPDETEALALLAVPAFSLDRLRERLDQHGLCHLTSQLSAARVPSGTKIEIESFDPAAPATKRWHDRFRLGK